jgi:hypothetical protein
MNLVSVPCAVAHGSVFSLWDWWGPSRSNCPSDPLATARGTDPSAACHCPQYGSWSGSASMSRSSAEFKSRTMLDQYRER